VEALAAQIALTIWRTLLLGVKFEIFSDHDSLQYLFTQKSPSQRILSLCEFNADYNFEEVKYVLGLQNVVPDFLSCPWEATANEPASLHMLVKRWPKRKSSQPNKTRPVQPCVIVIPTGRTNWLCGTRTERQVCGPWHAPLLKHLQRQHVGPFEH